VTEQEFSCLQTGDIVKSDLGSKTFIVTSNYGGRVTAVTTVDMTNPFEWELVAKAHHTIKGCNTKRAKTEI
jgi:hypothetical protein